MSADDIPRRIRIDKMTPAELAIRSAVLEVEEIGADPRLTDAVVLLQQAQEKVADYVDEWLAKQKLPSVNEMLAEQKGME